MSPTSTRRNTLWAAIDFVVTPVGMLFAIPRLLAHLGLEQFGVLVLANTLIAFSSLFNFGFGDTALKYVSHYVGLGDSSGATRMARTLGALAMASGLLVGALFWWVAPYATRALHLAELPYALGSLQVIAFTMALRMTESVYVAIIRGAYRYDLAAYVTVFTKALAIVLQVVLATRGFGVVGILVAVAACVALSNSLLLATSCRQLGNVLPRFSSQAFAELRAFSGWSWLQGIGGLIYANTDRLLVTALLGPSAIAVYGVCMQLAQNIHYGLSAVSHSFFPTVSMLRASAQQGLGGADDRLRQAYVRVGRLLCIAAVVTGCAIAVFAREVLELWVGDEVAGRGADALAILALSFGWFASNSIVTYYTLNGLGRAKLQAGASVISAALMFLSCVALIPSFGLLGAAAVRFPDSLYRMGLRIYIGSSIIGSIRWWAALDFLRATIVAGGSLYLLRLSLYHWSTAYNVLRTPSSIAVVAGVVSVGAIAYWIEERLGMHAIGTKSIVPSKVEIAD